MAETSTAWESRSEKGTEMFQACGCPVWKSQPAPEPATLRYEDPTGQHTDKRCRLSSVSCQSGTHSRVRVPSLSCWCTTHFFLPHKNTYHKTNSQMQNAHTSLTVIVGARFHNTIGRSQKAGHILSVFLQDKIVKSARRYLLA